MRSFDVGYDKSIGKMYGINLDCLDDVTDEELSTITITYVDGLNDKWHETPPFHRHL